mmetsp:Transcript_5129/g.16201  ORF Transcript_5129/g.16201 Transcript_5129/m.16201 type:complete len:243 (+) Transcript_5129:350-1078(+)
MVALPRLQPGPGLRHPRGHGRVPHRAVDPHPRAARHLAAPRDDAPQPRQLCQPRDDERGAVPPLRRPGGQAPRVRLPARAGPRRGHLGVAVRVHRRLRRDFQRHGGQALWPARLWHARALVRPGLHVPRRGARPALAQRRRRRRARFGLAQQARRRRERGARRRTRRVPVVRPRIPLQLPRPHRHVLEHREWAEELLLRRLGAQGGGLPAERRADRFWRPGVLVPDHRARVRQGRPSVCGHA